MEIECKDISTVLSVNHSLTPHPITYSYNPNLNSIPDPNSIFKSNPNPDHNI